MAASMWNARVLIPPPNNFFDVGQDHSPEDPQEKFQGFHSSISKVDRWKESHFPLLKGEIFTLSRLIYKHKNAMRSWKFYHLLTGLKKSLERISEAKFHSYQRTLASHLNRSSECEINHSTTILQLPSRQMLEYFLVSLQGCARLCVHIINTCEQAAVMMVQSLHRGMFISINMVLLAVVSRVRVLTCNLLKSTALWYDTLLPWRSQLPSAKADWLPDGSELAMNLMDWLGEDAKRHVTMADRRSATASEKSECLDKLFNSSVESDVTAVQLQQLEGSSNCPVVCRTAVPDFDLGEKMSEEDIAVLRKNRSSGKNAVPLRVLQKSNKKAQSGTKLQLKRKLSELKSKVLAKTQVGWHPLNGTDSPQSRKRHRHNAGHTMRPPTNVALSKTSGGQGKVQKRKPSRGRRKRSSKQVLRRSLSRESTSSSSSYHNISVNRARKERLNSRLQNLQRKRMIRRNSKDNNGNLNSLVYVNAQAVSPNSAQSLSSFPPTSKRQNYHPRHRDIKGFIKSRLFRWKTKPHLKQDFHKSYNDSSNTSTPLSIPVLQNESDNTLSHTKPGRTKKGKLVKRLQKTSWKVKARGRKQNITDSSLYYANSNTDQPTPVERHVQQHYHPRHQPQRFHEQPQPQNIRAGGHPNSDLHYQQMGLHLEQLHGRGKQIHAHRYPRSHQLWQQGGRPSYQLQDVNQALMLSQQKIQRPPPHGSSTSAAAEQRRKLKGTEVAKRDSGKSKGDTDKEMDLIFSSLL